MTTKTRTTIELDKILHRLAEKAVCPETRRAAEALAPLETVEDVRMALQPQETQEIGQPVQSGQVL